MPPLMRILQDYGEFSNHMHYITHSINFVCGYVQFDILLHFINSGHRYSPKVITLVLQATFYHYYHRLYMCLNTKELVWCIHIMTTMVQDILAYMPTSRKLKQGQILLKDGIFTQKIGRVIKDILLQYHTYVLIQVPL